MRRAIGALIVVLAALAPGIAVAAPDPPDPGQTTAGTVTSNGTEYEYLLYTPTSYGRAARRRCWSWSTAARPRPSSR